MYALKEYTLTAELGNDSESITIEALGDSDAMMDAIGVIMDKAYQQDNAWAKGRIELINPDGEVIKFMEAK
jgi:hypothetical protein